MITLYFFGSLVERWFVPYIGSWGSCCSIFGDRGGDPADLPASPHARAIAAWARRARSPRCCSPIFWCSVSLIFVFFLPVPAILYAALYIGYSIWMDKRGGDNVNTARICGAPRTA